MANTPPIAPSNLPMILPDREQTQERAVAKVPLTDFVDEVRQDLRVLIAEFPAGIYISHLVEWYGESASRCTRVCQILNEEKTVVIQQSASKAYYIIPAWQAIATVQYPELTLLQRQCVLLVQKLLDSDNAGQLRTNISQLARLLAASYGGVRACIIRLEKLGYLEVRTPSLRGRQDQMLLALGPKADQKKAT